MEAQDRLEEELAHTQQTMAGLQKQHHQVAAELAEVQSAPASSLPEDLAQMTQLSDQVTRDI